MKVNDAISQKSIVGDAHLSSDGVLPLVHIVSAMPDLSLPSHLQGGPDYYCNNFIYCQPTSAHACTIGN